MNPPHVTPHTRPSHLQNGWTRGHLNDSHNRFHDVSQRHPEGIRGVNNYANRYRHEARQALYDRGHQVTAYYHQNNYRYYYSHWYNHGFYGGDWYPVRPCYDPQVYFVYPVVFWIFYTDDDTTDYYNNYYQDWAQNQPAPQDPNDTYANPANPFPFRGVFYPTDTLKDLGIEVSAMDAETQANFRESLTDFVQALQDEVSDQRTQAIQFEKYEVVVNHYENLQNQAIVIEGFADRAGVHYSFKALIDLVDPSQTLVFVPSTQDPTNDNTQVLDQMNARIVQLGGNPYTADQEPENQAPLK